MRTTGPPTDTNRIPTVERTRSSICSPCPTKIPDPGGSPPRIVIRAPNWLGDLVVATGFISVVLEREPKATVDLIVPAGLEMLPLPHRGRIHIFDRRRCSAGAFGASLRAEDYDRFYILPPSFSAVWMAWRSGTPERIGYPGQFRSLLLRPSVSRRNPPRGVLLHREYLDLLDPTLDPDLHLPRLDLSESWTDAHLSGIHPQLPKLFLAVAPGAIYGPAKAWPAANTRACTKLARSGGDADRHRRHAAGI